jgi:hypothetical protein
VQGNPSAHASIRQGVGEMNLAREIPVALCDVAGLRWGASGFGGENVTGDVQHFDASEVISIPGIGTVHAVLIAAGRVSAQHGDRPLETWRSNDQPPPRH